MSAFKVLSAGILVLALAHLAPGQSLAEAAKKEKERRESLKGKSGVVVTNANLGATKKKPAVASQTPAGSEKPAPQAPAPAAATSAVPAADPQVEAKKTFDEKKAELEDRLGKAKEMVELLTLKMKALQQQFYSFNTMTFKEQVQIQISETFQKWQAAQAAEQIIKDELDQLLAKGWKSE